MQIEGLDYNTQRPKMLMHEYGREVQTMVEHALTLPSKEERQQCAETIIATMRRLTPGNQKNADRMQTLWNHLAILADGKLDIDYPVELTIANDEDFRPEVVPYPSGKIPVRHYGKELFLVFDRLKEMEPGEERDALVRMAANQMKRCLILYGHGNSDNEKIADDLARFTDGTVQIDPMTFRFEAFDVRDVDVQQMAPKKKKRKKK